MPGVLGHVTAGVLSALIVYLIHFKFEYSLSIFVGNLLPDVLKFGVAALRQGTLNLFGVTQDAAYQSFAAITYSPANWFTAGFFVLGAALLLYHFHYIKEKTMEEYDELYVFLLIGVLVHLFMDAYYIESSPWI